MFLKQALNVLTILYHLLQTRNLPRANAAVCVMISHMANSAIVDSPLFFAKAKPTVEDITQKRGSSAKKVPDSAVITPPIAEIAATEYERWPRD